jgi:hypothetical protein
MKSIACFILFCALFAFCASASAADLYPSRTVKLWFLKRREVLPTCSHAS